MRVALLKNRTVHKKIKLPTIKGRTKILVFSSHYPSVFVTLFECFAKEAQWDWQIVRDFSKIAPNRSVYVAILSVFETNLSVLQTLASASTSERK